MAHALIRQFFLPRLTRATRFRILGVALLSLIIFRYILIPVRVQGMSMEPTISDGSFHFCWRLSYLYQPPKRFDIVTFRFAGNRVVLLKRVIGLPGETVAFQQGVLYINGKQMEEPQYMFPSTWNLAPRKVSANTFYVVGDNRSVAMDQHRFGQIVAKRIIGKVIW